MSRYYKFNHKKNISLGDFLPNQNRNSRKRYRRKNKLDLIVPKKNGMLIPTQVVLIQGLTNDDLLLARKQINIIKQKKRKERRWKKARLNLIWFLYKQYYLHDKSRLEKIRLHKASTKINRYWRRMSGFYAKNAKFDIFQDEIIPMPMIRYQYVSHEPFATCPNAPLRFTNRSHSCCCEFNDIDIYNAVTNSRYDSMLSLKRIILMLSRDNITHRLRNWLSLYLKNRLVG